LEINTILEITILILACGCYFFSAFFFFKKRNVDIALLLVVVGGFILRLYIASDRFLHAWDERYHALVAKNLLLNPLKPSLYFNPVLAYDYTQWTCNHIWLHKQPIPLWTMAGSMKLFGVNELALRLPSVILSTLGIWITFLIGTHFFNRRIAYIAAFLFSVNGLILELTGGRITTDHFDIHFLFFIELAILFSILYVQNKKVLYNALTGLCIGIAILTKWLPALIVLPIWVVLVLHARKKVDIIFFKQFVLLIVCTLIVVLPWIIYIFHEFPQEAAWEMKYNSRHLSEAIERHSGSFLFYVTQIRIDYGELIYIPLCWFLWKLIKEKWDYKNVVLFVWFGLPFLFFSIVQTKMQAYILFTCPALFIIIAQFYIQQYDSLKRKKKPMRIIITIVLVLLIILPIRYSIERLKPFTTFNQKPAWVTDLQQVKIKSSSILFNYHRPIEAMFYKDITAYAHLPNRDAILQLVDKGLNVVVNNDGNLPNYIIELEQTNRIEIVNYGE
jgi:4-amino-4-deoxy-L-arabinose transferase-like glycosyltransferase